MSPFNPVLKLLGLCALVLGLMAVGATAAEAEESGGKWTFINGSFSLQELPNNEAFGAELETGTHLTLLTQILKKNVEILCKSITVRNGRLFTGGTLLMESLVFHECITKVGGAIQAACEPNAKGLHKGLIESLPIKGTLLLHKLEAGTKDKILILEPDVGSNALIHTEMSELCSIGEDALFGGKLALIPTNPETHEVKHLIKEFSPLTHLWVISDTAEHKATLDGSMLMFLNGPNIGKTWAALWN
jgi:hypothetical protein